MKIKFAAILFTLAPLAVADYIADQMLTRYFIAMGGAASNRVQTRHSEGSLETPGGRAGLTLWQKAPNRVVLELRLPRGTMRRGFDGIKGWDYSTISGHRPMPAQAQKLFVEQYSLATGSPDHILTRFPKRERLNDEQMRMTEIDGDSEVWTFDPATNLLIKVTGEFDGGPQGIVPVTIWMQDYKKVDGLMLPHTIRTKTKASETTMRLDRIEHAVSIDDSTFKTPSQP